MKQHLNITIDMDIYLKTKMQNINVSSLCNEFLKTYTEQIGTQQTTEEKEMEEEINEITKSLEELRTTLILKQSQLFKIKEEKEIQAKIAAKEKVLVIE